MLLLGLCLASSSSCDAATEQLSNLPASSTQNAGARTLLRVYDECNRAESGFVPCLKKKAISFIDRIAPIDAINVADGIKLVRLETAPRPPAYSDNELESSLARSGSERDVKLTNMLLERLSYFFNGHSLQVSFPKLTSDEIGRGLEEGKHAPLHMPHTQTLTHTQLDCNCSYVNRSMHLAIARDSDIILPELRS